MPASPFGDGGVRNEAGGTKLGNETTAAEQRRRG
jgi:hypothetical protein